MRALPALAALATLVCTAAQPQQVRISLATDNSVFVTWLDDGKALVKPCAQHAPAVRRLRWRTQYAVSHTYAGSTQGQWNGVLYTALLHHIPRGKPWVYRVGDCATDDWGPATAFHVPALPSEGSYGYGDPVVSMIVFGDQGVGEHSHETASAMDAAVLKGDVDMVLHLGDFGYNLPDPMKRNWDTTEAWYIELKQRTWDYWGKMMQPVTAACLYMVLGGNHETAPYDLDFAPLKHRFPMPWTLAHVNDDEDDTSAVMLDALLAGGDALNNIQMWYSFNVAGMHIVMLDTEGDFSLASAQHVWLAADLAAVDPDVTTHIIVCGHRPMYSSAVKEGSNLALRAAIEPLLIKHRVSLYLAGHDHSYERTHPIFEPNAVGAAARADADVDGWRGTVHVRVATAGITHLSKWTSEEAPAWSATRQAAFGFGRLDLLADGDLKFEFHKTGVEGGHPDDGLRGAIDSVVVPAPRTPVWAVHHPEPLAGLTVDGQGEDDNVDTWQEAHDRLRIQQQLLEQQESRQLEDAGKSLWYVLKTVALVGLVLVAAFRVWGSVFKLYRRKPMAAKRPL